jgi:hypothetical protein
MRAPPQAALFHQGLRFKLDLKKDWRQRAVFS